VAKKTQTRKKVRIASMISAASGSMPGPTAGAPRLASTSFAKIHLSSAAPATALENCATQ
jgi:hypothetical protein